MSQPNQATKSFVFYSFLFAPEINIKEFIIANYLDDESSFGDFIFFHHQYFPMKDYYSKEMGQDLQRCFVINQRPQERDFLIKEKKKALALEKKNSKDINRLINIDPGLINLENLILATFKSYAHRVYLTDNVYAELTYTFKDGSYSSLPWTYPDYNHPEIIDFFNWTRKLLHSKIS